MTTPLIELARVSYSAPHGRRLADNLDLTVMRGQMLLVSGPNGCGKSTLLKILLGRMNIERGTLRLSVPEKKIAYIPQLENTDVHLPFTLRDVLETSVTGALDIERVEELELVEADQLDHAWNTASGGERKRTLLTRALLAKPDLLLFDEPMNHLDGASRKAVVRALANFLSADANRAAVLVCHKGLENEERALFNLVELEFPSRGEA